MHEVINRHRIWHKFNNAQSKRIAECTVLPGQRYKTLLGALLSDAGGIELCSRAKRQPIRRFAAASVLAEQLEARLANGERINTAEHALLVSSLVRLIAKIGISRHSKVITPTVSEYLAKRRRNGGDASADDIEVEAAE